MFTIISFILTLLGSINWLLIGLLQYDFVAGIFGYQASIFSRIIYIIIGASSVFLVYKLIKGKGTIAVFSRRNKKAVLKNIEKMSKKSEEKYYQESMDNHNTPIYNVEAGHDHYIQNDEKQHSYNPDYDDNNTSLYEHGNSHKSLFDEHFDNK